MTGARGEGGQELPFTHWQTRPFSHTDGLDSQQPLYTHLLDEETEAERKKVAYSGAGRQAQVSSSFFLCHCISLLLRKEEMWNAKGTRKQRN